MLAITGRDDTQDEDRPPLGLGPGGLSAALLGNATPEREKRVAHGRVGRRTISPESRTSKSASETRRGTSLIASDLTGT